MRSFVLDRRTFLRGAGVALALPLLEAMMPRRILASPPVPRRFVGFYVPNGIHMAGFTPAEVGADYAPTPLLRPLIDAGHRAQVLILSGLENFAATAQGDGPGDHARGTASFLTAAHVRKSEANLANGVSLDQVIAQASRGAGAPTFPSLELGCEGGRGSGSCDSGYGCAYSRSIAWSGPATPMPKMTHPRAVFDRLFAPPGAGGDADRAALHRALRKSVLDVVRDDTERLTPRLGTSDRRKVEEYLAGIREVERRIDAPTPETACAATTPRPEGVPEDLETYVRLMLDLIALAFQCDQTRVVTFMLGNGASGRSYRSLGIQGGHHELSHHQGDPAKLAALAAIGTWEIAQLAHLLTRLSEIREGDGTILDHSTVFFSSEIEDGNTHAHANLPVLLAGRAGGAFSPGRHLTFPAHTPIANLFLSILAAFEIPAERFGDDGTSTLSGLG